NPGSNRNPGRRRNVAGLRKPGESQQPSPHPRDEAAARAAETGSGTAADTGSGRTESAATDSAAVDSAAVEAAGAEPTGPGSAASEPAADEAPTDAATSGPRRKKRSIGSQKPVAADGVVGAADPGTPPARLTGARTRSSRGRWSARTMYILVAVLVLLAGVFGTGAWFASSQYSEASAATSNTALINVDRTQQVKKAMSKAAERLFSYDYRKI